jgi:hypothetical protein
MFSVELVVFFNESLRWENDEETVHLYGTLVSKQESQKKFFDGLRMISNCYHHERALHTGKKRLE